MSFVKVAGCSFKNNTFCSTNAATASSMEVDVAAVLALCVLNETAEHEYRAILKVMLDRHLGQYYVVCR